MSEKKAFVEKYLSNLGEVLTQLDSGAIDKAILWLREARDQNKMIFICGNGGSASISSQMAVDIVKGASYGRNRRFRMMSLTESVATITAYANDVNYDRVFVEPLMNFAEPGDILIAISGSGNSANVLKAVEFANGTGVKTIGLTTHRDNKLLELAQLPLAVPSDHMGHLEDCFFIITHILCYAFIEDKKF